MRKTIIGVALGVLVSVGLATPAEAATISCRTAVTLNGRGDVATVRVVSNHPDTHLVHSYIAYWDRGLFRGTGSQTIIPAGPGVTFRGHYYFKIRSWQSGTECRQWFNPSEL